MIRVDSINHIKESNKRIRDYRSGFITNLFFDVSKFEKWIKNNQLYYLYCNETAFYFRLNGSFKNSYFSSVSNESLKAAILAVRTNYPDDSFVFDIIGEREKLGETVKIFTTSGFNIYTVLTRMSRLVENEPGEVELTGMRFANPDDLHGINILLYQYFDVYSEQLPDLEDLNSWMQNNHILIALNGDTIIGFLIFDIIGIASYLRYWFVHPDYREKKVGSALLKRFFFECRNTKRQYFWVIENNENAIKRYIHYGFKQENLIDYVFTNLNKQYEAESNRNFNRDQAGI